MQACNFLTFSIAHLSSSIATCRASLCAQFSNLRKGFDFLFTTFAHWGSCEKDVTVPVQGYMFRSAFLKRVPLFVRNISENVVLCLLAATVESTSKRILETVKLDWRKQLTDNIQQLYFSNMVSLTRSLHAWWKHLTGLGSRHRGTCLEHDDLQRRVFKGSSQAICLEY